VLSPALRWTLVVAAEALLIALMLPFGYEFTISLGVHRFQLILLAIVGGIGWLAVLRWPYRLPWQVLLAPLPLLGAMAISSIASSYPSLGWSATWQVAAYIGIFWMLALQASHPDGRRNLIGVIAIVLVLVTVSFALAVAMAWRDWLELGFSLTSLPLRPASSGGLTLIPTWFADLAVTTVPLIVAVLWHRGARWVSVAVAAAAVTEIVVSGTRSVLLLLAGLFVVTLVFLVGRRRGGCAVAISAVASLAIATAGGAVFLASGRSIDEGRFSAYASAVDQFAHAPLLGGGPGTYGERRLTDVVDVIGHLVFPDAHNIILNTAAEIGLVGVLGLLAIVLLLGTAVLGAWREAPGERSIIAGGLFGIAVLAGHGMVDVIFGLIGIVIVAIAVVALVVTRASPARPSPQTNRRWILPPLAAALAVAVASSAFVLRTETTFGALDAADQNLKDSPSQVLATASDATHATPDVTPAWLVQMVAADAIGDLAGAITAARQTIRLEGFGQQWMMLAILASRSDDRATELDAIAHATSGPTDPFVELNASILLDAAGDPAAAETAARQLLLVEPDVEQVLEFGPTALSTTVARVRPAVAQDRLAAGDADAAFVIALTGEDHPLADALVATLATSDKSSAGMWATIVDAWFGDASARATLDAASVASPTQSHLLWSWRIAVHACDPSATKRWEQAIVIGIGYLPTTPTALGVTPGFQSRMLPDRYPPFIWHVDNLERPYVIGTWTYSLGRPDCVDAGAG
jgi:hypothetical protein